MEELKRVLEEIDRVRFEITSIDRSDDRLTQHEQDRVLQLQRRKWELQQELEAAARELVK